MIAPKGLDGVVVEKTVMSRVDGQAGILVYRGYHIDEIAKCSFEEVCYLFLYGKLPTSSELEKLDQRLKSHRHVDNHVINFIEQAPVGEEPMALLRTAVSMLSGYLPKVEDNSPDALTENAIALISKVSTIAAAISRVKHKKAPVEPDLTLSHAANYLYMSQGEKVDEVVSKTLDTALVLHIDHGFNASTFSARVVVSTLTDIVSAVTAAIGSLKGPLHGGANTAVMNMLLEIGEIENVESYVKEAMEKKQKIPGFGHRVYKTFDPRAKHLKAMSEAWGKRVGEVKWFKMSEKLEALMMTRKELNANVDFYSASTYYAMGINPELYTVIFAVARMVGWTSHIIEQLADNRLMRPESEYVGPEDLKWVPITDR
ncbi:MAG: citrate/2-methylcitrate synthase [Myxococcaceae bacterium]